MIIAMFKLPITEGREEEFSEGFRQRKGLIDQMKGFVSLDVLRPLEGNVHTVMTVWLSMEDFEAWTRSEEFAQAHSKKHPGMASGPPVMEFHEVIVSSRVDTGAVDSSDTV